MLKNSSPLNADEFNERLATAAERRDVRLNELQRWAKLDRIFLFGYGGKGRALARDIQKQSTVKVVIYDSSPSMREAAARDGFATVHAREEMDQSEFAVILGACQAQMEQAALVKAKTIFYQEAAHIFDAPHLSHKVRDFSTWIARNSALLFDVYRSVHGASRTVFLDVLRFRLSLDPRDIIPSRRPNSEMWFDVPTAHASKGYGTFLDVGAYDGDTLMQAAKRLSVTRGIAVEANSDLFASIEVAGRAYPKGVLILPHAAWSHQCRLQFSEVRGGMISVSEANDGELAAAPIDNEVLEQVDFIKIDIEGAEIRALSGCVETLKSRPDLAIAAYHRPEDLVALPAFLHNVGYENPDFDLHVAHYSDCLDDTILYWLKANGSAANRPEAIE